VRYRLRHGNRELALAEGSLVVGRSSSCHLFLDDPLVSRRHAIFVVSGGRVMVEDQRSRNGVLVNDQPITGRMTLKPGDRVLIGSQELTLVAAAIETSKTMDESMGRKTLSRVAAGPGAAHGSDAPTSVSVPPVTAPPATPPKTGAYATAPPVSGSPESDATAVRRANAFKLLSSVAEKALALGRADEADRLLSGPVLELVEATRSGQRLSPTLVDTVARLAARLAGATGKGTWVDYVVELYRAQARPCPATVIDELNVAVRRVSSIDSAALRAYLAALQGKQASLGPAERFLLQRLEGLERLVGLR
jgi:pSer/pThr/pTyr-binding forkhead associated (FHA) protein